MGHLSPCRLQTELKLSDNALTGSIDDGFFTGFDLVIPGACICSSC